MICIAKATEDDMPRIMEIEREAIIPPWTEGTLLSEIHREDSFFAVAKGDGGCQADGSPDTQPMTLGFVILRRAGDDCELFQIAVDKAARRQSVADMLMGSALDNAIKSGLASVHLEVRKSNNAAFCLYKKHGFEPVRSRKDYYVDPVEDAVVMVKKLKNY